VLDLVRSFTEIKSKYNDIGFSGVEVGNLVEEGNDCSCG
jgi:hypothetical protein